MGSAPNAAATSAVSHPVKQGLIQSLGVFFDTMLVCTATAIMILYILVCNLVIARLKGSSYAISVEHLGSAGGIFLTVAVTLFAFSSVVGNYYYGQSNIEFLSNKR